MESEWMPPGKIWTGLCTGVCAGMREAPPMEKHSGTNRSDHCPWACGSKVRKYCHQTAEEVSAPASAEEVSEGAGRV